MQQVADTGSFGNGNAVATDGSSPSNTKALL